MVELHYVYIMDIICLGNNSICILRMYHSSIFFMAKIIHVCLFRGKLFSLFSISTKIFEHKLFSVQLIKRYTQNCTIHLTISYFSRLSSREMGIVALKVSRPTVILLFFWGYPYCQLLDLLLTITWQLPPANIMNVFCCCFLVTTLHTLKFPAEFYLFSLTMKIFWPWKIGTIIVQNILIVVLLKYKVDSCPDKRMFDFWASVIVVIDPWLPSFHLDQGRTSKYVHNILECHLLYSHR